MALKIEFLVTARRQDGSGSLARSEDAYADTGYGAGRPAASRPTSA